MTAKSPNAASGERPATARALRIRPLSAKASKHFADEPTAARELVSRRLGCPVHLISSEEITQRNASRRPRRYVKYVFEAAGNAAAPVTVFAKTGNSFLQVNAPLQHFLSGLTRSEFRVPVFFGLATTGRGRMGHLGVWEFVAPGPKLTVRERMSYRASFVLAAAAIASVTEGALHNVQRIRGNVPFVRPASELADRTASELARRGVDVSFLSDGPTRLSALEAGALQHLDSLGRYLTHVDYRPANMILRPGEVPVIFDWDSASLGPPGATLRTLARLPDEEQKDAVALYCAHLAGLGIQLNNDDVLFAMRAVEIFHAFIFAARQASVPEANQANVAKLFRWAVEHLHYLQAPERRAVPAELAGNAPPL